MEAWFALLVGIFFTVAIYLLLSKYIIRVLLGVAVLGNAVNLLIFTGGRLTRGVPPVIPEGADTLAGPAANALPQALILTAIVISFSFFAFLLVLAWRAYEDLSTDNTDEMRVAEPEEEPAPPLGY
ncbi:MULTISPECIES: Na+/H+ antiporter subunit C [Ensifer]|uniref:Na+/H+ antiporter subunit C n=1 Tax=Ensifer canadensis TaxID=555315 RepID=A0AAW4FSW6_9HYPH|nr:MULTISPECIES: Na+/H+ antiporter subunit C [Ensifer]KQU72166.1 cation:proton antiporter [Ensifer sp. Root31]KQW44351.1 cation:proton antiporter [Ensifer sp. Root1252]KQW84518.1 cation:proton antiporter [Ensifer sp. Root127]KQY71761.1 cation:proton antiporter [Ensifer sp. Root142]KRC58066.1 cation:proton antiporter [Ensifer sp. Root231]